MINLTCLKEKFAPSRLEIHRSVIYFRTHFKYVFCYVSSLFFKQKNQVKNYHNHAFRNLNKKIAVVGLGYVGLPLAVAFSKKFEVVGYDINTQRIDELNKGIDSTLEIDTDELQNLARLSFTSDLNPLKNANFIIVTVPTPVTTNKNSDFNPLINVAIGKILLAGTTVIYESTVFPRPQEEICVPILEQESNLKLNTDFM